MERRWIASQTTFSGGSPAMAVHSAGCDRMRDTSISLVCVALSTQQHRRAIEFRTTSQNSKTVAGFDMHAYYHQWVVFGYKNHTIDLNRSFVFLAQHVARLIVRRF